MICNDFICYFNQSSRFFKRRTSWYLTRHIHVCIVKCKLHKRCKGLNVQRVLEVLPEGENEKPEFLQAITYLNIRLQTTKMFHHDFRLCSTRTDSTSSLSKKGFFPPPPPPPPVPAPDGRDVKHLSPPPVPWAEKPPTSQSDRNSLAPAPTPPRPPPTGCLVSPQDGSSGKS